MLCLVVQRGVKPLHMASRYGHADVVKALIDEKASIRATGEVNCWLTSDLTLILLTEW